MKKEITINGEKYIEIDDKEYKYKNIIEDERFVIFKGVIYKKEEKPSLYPEKDEIYFCLNKKGTSVKHRDKGKIRGPKPADIGNYFKNREGANKKGKELRAIQRVKEYIVTNFGYHPERWADWSNKNIPKYTIYWEEECGRGLGECFSETCKHYSPFGYLKTREDSYKLIKDKKEDLETIYKPK